MTVFVVGGSKSGKSDFAQQIALKLAAGGKHYYVATMQKTGSEADSAIIRSHLRRRAGMGFETVEQGREILRCVRDPRGTYLLDSVTALLSNAFFPAEKHYEPDGELADRCAEDLLALTEKVQNLVLVSDDIFRDAQTYEDGTEAFRGRLGALHCRLSEICDVVMEMTHGVPAVLKGEWI